MDTDIRLWWKDRQNCENFRTGVSLHSHTLHSHEWLTFIPQYISALPLVAGFIRREARRHGLPDIPYAEFSRAWWTPPLSAHAAWKLEALQIEERLQMRAMVSITDHDSIEAAAMLNARRESSGAPISLEWTVPYLSTSFHIGVHNLPPNKSRALVETMSQYTAGGSEDLLAGILEELSHHPETLIVLNHPLWDEGDVGPGIHRFALGRLLGRYETCVHALELNADRSWRENRAVLDLARLNAMPVVSGGDRHGCDPSPVVNLTNAVKFSEFAQEVREGRSVIAVLPRFRESRKVRLFETAFDVLRDHPDHGLGWVHWSDRVFYRHPDGTVASVSKLWGRKQPGTVSSFINLMSVLRRQQIRPALRWALAEPEATF